MRLLNLRDANEYLSRIGMHLGDWQQPCDTGDRQRGASHVRMFRPHEHDALNLCHHLVAWLPNGDWRLFQIDHSTGWIDPIQMSLVSGLLYGVDIRDLNDCENRSFLFTFGGSDAAADANSSLTIANLMYVFLLLRLHAYVVSSGSRDGEMVALQDGVVYLSSRRDEMSRADALVDALARRPSARPQWILDLIAQRQEQTLVRVHSGPAQ
jgi:hypothetical protein